MSHRQRICGTCKKSMRSDNLNRHMLWHHRHTECESAVPIVNSVINHLNDQPRAMKVIPYMNSSKSDDTVETPAKRVKIGTPMAPRKEHVRYSRVNRIIANCSQTHSDVEDDDDEYDDECDY